MSFVIHPKVIHQSTPEATLHLKEGQVKAVRNVETES